ncbi:hypothetical protein diail_5961 [Diaporthe ilicicola]|nr:hypothetical protein diail_5961 [Diaporthe ilicicola]
MKFAHQFKETLEREAFPDHWRAAAIPYSQLKKCLKKVQRELQGLGLDKETLQRLQSAQTVSPDGVTVPMARYNLDQASQSLRPCLSVFVHLQDGQAVDAGLSPASRELLQRLSGKQLPPLGLDQDPGPDAVTRDDTSQMAEGQSAVAEEGLERIEIPLVFDGEFFNILQSDVDSLDILQQQEEKSMEADITTLGREVSAVTRPSKFSKSDLNRWREIFDLYVDAQIFFSSHEIDHGSRSSARAVQNLVWFQKEIQKRDLLNKFKMPTSKLTYNRFLQLNATLLQNLKFQEINKTAINKILKKFDKRTSLGASVSFRAAVRSQKFLAGNVAKKMCAQLAHEVVSVVPRVDDYTCPICFSIAWYPVRLRCSHIFCVRCVIKMQREKKKQCPLCRDEVVMEADLSNIDKNLEKFMRLYFRRETDEKQRANEIERGREIFGPSEFTKIPWFNKHNGTDEMTDSTKRKAGNDAAGVAAFKKKKKGNNGKWKVPRADAPDRPRAHTIEPGDMGIWYAEKMYGIKSGVHCDTSEAEDEDIESAIQKEVGALKDKGRRESDGILTEVRIKEECLLFMRCKAPIEPVEFSRRICQDAANVGHGAAKARYLNRLTPLIVIEKASENGLDEAARKALAGCFKLKAADYEKHSNPEVTGSQSETGHGTTVQEAQPVTYAIRPSIRSHSTLKRDNVIKRIADAIDPVHKVNLGAPDKVILVDIYQTVCGLSVVPGDWESLKRYNLTELYKLSTERKGQTRETEKSSGTEAPSTT